jgi:hypothetical protein
MQLTLLQWHMFIREYQHWVIDEILSSNIFIRLHTAMHMQSWFFRQ